MSLNNKKSPEELDEIINSEIEETVEEEPEVVDVEDRDPEEIEELEEPEDTPEEPQEPEQEPDIEERYRESSREAQALFFKNQKMQNTVAEAANQPEPTEEDIKTYAKELGEDYDNLDNFTKNVLKENLKSRRITEKINEVFQESQEVEKWNAKVDTFISDEKILNKYPTLANNAEDFKKYASHSTRRGADIEDLVAAFLYRYGESQPKKKKSLLLGSTSSRNEKPKPKGLTEDDLRALRSSPDGQRKYKEAIKKGKIDL